MKRNKLTPAQQRVLEEIRDGRVCYRYVPILSDRSYYCMEFLGRVTRQVQKLIGLGLLKGVNVDYRGQCDIEITAAGREALDETR